MAQEPPAERMPSPPTLAEAVTAAAPIYAALILPWVNETGDAKHHEMMTEAVNRVLDLWDVAGAMLGARARAAATTKEHS